MPRKYTYTVQLTTKRIIKFKKKKSFFLYTYFYSFTIIKHFMS